MSLDTNVIQQYYAGILRLTPSAATINAYAQLPSYEAAMDAMMNAAVSSVNPITKLYQAAFDRVPDSAGLTNYTAAYGAGAGTMTLQQIANQWTSTIEFTTDYPASMPNADYVGLLYWNVLHRSADPVGAANFTAALNNGTMTRAGVLLELSQSPEFAYFIDGHIQGFQEQCALNNPVAYTGSLWDKVPPGPGETFTLTTGIDTFTATTDNATFNAVADTNASGNNTMNSGDVLTGAGGINALNITGLNTTPGLVTTTNVELVNVRAVGATSFSQLLMDGVDVVSSNNSLAGLTVRNADLGSTYALNNTVVGQTADLTVDYTSASGLLDIASLAINNAGDKTAAGVTTTQAITLLVGGAAATTIEAVELTTAGTNYATLTAGTGAESITVDGAGNSNIRVLTAAAADLDFDASATTGTNTFSFADSLVKTSTTIAGGAGTDTLRVESTGSYSMATPTVTGVEKLQGAVSAGHTVSVGLGRTTGLTTVDLAAGNGRNTGTLSVTQLPGTVATLTATAVAANAAGANELNALKINSSWSGASDSLTYNVNTVADLIDSAGLLTSTNLESLTINLTADDNNYAATLGGVTATGLTDLTINTAGFVDAAADVSLTVGTVTASGKTVATVDMSGADTGVSIAFASTSLDDSAVVTGGTGNDVIDTSAVALSAATAQVTIVGGQGADSLYAVTTGEAVWAIAEGDSGITVATADSITNFTTLVDALALGVAATTGAGNNFTNAGAVAGSFAAALTAANFDLLALSTSSLSTQNYAVQGVGTDSYVFIDYDLDGTADSVITLVGITNGTAAAIVAADVISA